MDAQRFRLSISLVVGLGLVSGLAMAQEAKPPAAPCKEQVIDKVVAVIEGKDAGREGVTIILVSDLKLAARVDAIRVFGRDGMNVELTNEVLNRVLREEEGGLIIYKEAMKYDVVAVSRDQVLRARDELAGRIGGPAELDAWLQRIGVSIATLEAYLQRQLVVDGFLGYKKAEVAPPDDAAVRKLYDSGENPYAGRPFDEVKEKLREIAHARAVTEALAQWKKELRSAYRIRYVEGQGGDHGG